MSGEKELLHHHLSCFSGGGDTGHLPRLQVCSLIVVGEAMLLLQLINVLTGLTPEKTINWKQFIKSGIQDNGFR